METTISATRAALTKTRIHVLCDGNGQVLDGARPLWFAGVDYPRSRSVFKLDGAASLDAALKGVPANAVKVLLAHHPDFFDGAAEKGVDLVLTSGVCAKEMARGAGTHGRHFESREALIAALPSILRKGDCVLVKASKGSHVETVAAALRELKLESAKD